MVFVEMCRHFGCELVGIYKEYAAAGLVEVKVAYENRGVSDVARRAEIGGPCYVVEG